MYNFNLLRKTQHPRNSVWETARENNAKNITIIIIIQLFKHFKPLMLSAKLHPELLETADRIFFSFAQPNLIHPRSFFLSVISFYCLH